MKRNAPSLITAPALEPVTLEEAKAHLRVDGNDEDALIGALITTAVGYLDGWGGILGRALITQTWGETFDSFPRGDVLRLRLAPVQSVTFIKYRDSANAEQTLPTTVYEGPFTDDLGGYVALRENQVWPSTYERRDAVSVQYVCGYGGQFDVPQQVRQAILLMIGDWYANRETFSSRSALEMPFSASALLSPLRRIGA